MPLTAHAHSREAAVMNKTLVMIHGMWGNSWYWQKYKEFFEGRGFRCITPTLRHHDVDPSSPPPPQLGTTSLLDYAEDLERGIKTLESPPIIMGHSMGGLLAQILGSRGLADKLVLLTPAAPRGILALMPSVLKSFSGVILGNFPVLWNKPIKQSFELAVYSMLHLLPEEEQREAYSKFVYESGRAASEIGFWLFDPRKASSVDQSKVTCPVLVIAGAEDRITPAPVIKQVADKYRPHSEYKEFAHHAHWVVGEPGWEEIAEYVYDWLMVRES